MGWDGMSWDGLGWVGMGWDGMGWDELGWDEMDGEMGEEEEEEEEEGVKVKAGPEREREAYIVDEGERIYDKLTASRAWWWLPSSFCGGVAPGLSRG